MIWLNKWDSDWFLLLISIWKYLRAHTWSKCSKFDSNRFYWAITRSHMMRYERWVTNYHMQQTHSNHIDRSINTNDVVSMECFVKTNMTHVAINNKQTNNKKRITSILALHVQSVTCKFIQMTHLLREFFCWLYLDALLFEWIEAHLCAGIHWIYSDFVVEFHKAICKILIHDKIPRMSFLLFTTPTNSYGYFQEEIKTNSILDLWANIWIGAHTAIQTIYRMHAYFHRTLRFYYIIRHFFPSLFCSVLTKIDLDWIACNRLHELSKLDNQHVLFSLLFL